MKKHSLIGSFIAMITVSLGVSVYFWESLIIWVNPLFPILFSVYACKKAKAPQRVYMEKILTNPFLYLLATVSAISTVVLYGSQILSTLTTIVTAPAFRIGLISFASLVILIGIVILIKRSIEDTRENKAMKKRQDAAEQKRRLDAEALKTKQDHARDLLDELLSGKIKPTWSVLHTISTVHVDIPQELLLSTPLATAMRSSSHLKKIHFTPAVVEFAMYCLCALVNTCDDTVIEKVITELKVFEEIRTFDGYGALYNIMMPIATRTGTQDFFSLHVPKKESARVAL